MKGCVVLERKKEQGNVLFYEDIFPYKSQVSTETRNGEINENNFHDDFLCKYDTVEVKIFVSNIENDDNGQAEQLKYLENEENHNNRRPTRVRRTSNI